MAETAVIVVYASPGSLERAGDALVSSGASPTPIFAYSYPRNWRATRKLEPSYYR